ncbi:MAG: RecQ family ATP-dependent DNA helicase [Proteobacteria bacterium]|nr:RecQ family ATP-dependent DNA helicase [Pseudomonadota bacterium]MBU1057527.1 RecQ family ATP-dependent DNA helicase [Pseudomonadota bacterium]
MSNDSQKFLSRCLLFDIETNENNEIYALGASFNGKMFTTQQGKKFTGQQLAEFDEFARGAEFLVGHNILAHDIPCLHEKAPALAILHKPVIDTLYLSPLAFPENPYHRLIKNYHIVRDSINNPAEDATLAGKVFGEQWDAFSRLLANGSVAPLLYRSFFDKDDKFAGISTALAAMGVSLIQDDKLYEVFSRLIQTNVCSKALSSLVDKLTEQRIEHPPLAYVTAWLTVAGSNSVLPPWVRHHFPVVPSLIHQLREQPCANAKCTYCSTNHNPHHFLQNYFGFENFRSQPASDDGQSLQGAIVAAAARGSSLFATLPTGGGKSLCYLLPALMRYHRYNALTIIISPLQALMKDQVDNFVKQTGTTLATAINGMLSMPERGAIIDGIRLGDVGILYVSPEQLRNRSFTQTISQREIGAWVFDEAHCLSKWGHDFRPDYLYAIRFIREFAQEEKTKIPPVQCFTATAKKDVQLEIIDILRRELGLRVLQFSGGHQRDNLHYEVWPVTAYEKNQTILALLKTRYAENGSVVIYCATRKNTENLAEFLTNAGYTVEAFHAGLEPFIKKRIQNDFIAGDTPIICATNAFGMGIDKDDVRLVIHADIPGSLENYLQEAGRAGRDRNEAECILIFTEQDVEGQFRMSCNSRLSQREIAQILQGLRSAAKNDGKVVLTSGEILSLETVDIEEDAYGQDRDTRVKTAVSWLEKSGFLYRNENDTRVFQGKPLVRTLTEAREKVEKLDLSKRQQTRWLDILAALMETPPSHGFSADDLAYLSSFSRTSDDPETETESQRVLRTLNDMAEQGLLSKETILSAYVRYKVQGSSAKMLKRFCQLEGDFLKILAETSPDADVEKNLVLDLRQVNQRLLDLGHAYCTPSSLSLVLRGLSRDGKGLAGQKGSISIRSRGNNIYSILLHRDWESLHKTVAIRQQAAHVALRIIQESLQDKATASASLLVEFTLEKIIDGFKKDLILYPSLKDPLAAAERALTFMHEQGVIELQQGLAVFRQAMTITLNPEAKGRKYTKANFEPLQTHYSEKNFQVHVINEYARCATEKISGAMNLVHSYFNDEKEEFIKRFFPGKEPLLERATSEQSYQRIVEDLNNQAQEEIVSAPTDNNILIMAGPGAGKTRTVSHRVAYLLRVKRVRPEAILILCFNRSAVIGLRRRLRDLVGKEMSRVTTLTFHGLALRLTGRSLIRQTSETFQAEIDFSQVILDAIALLKGECDILGFAKAQPRDALMSRFSHILVDEYQDIDEEQYELISLLAGKTLNEQEQRLTILAVGDDDQNIYRFRGANVDFIRRFKADYQAKVHYLTENYRSTANIIATGNALIVHNQDRMKREHPIQINRARATLPAGSNWQVNDPLAQGKVQCLQVTNTTTQALVLLEEFQRLQSLSSDFDLNSCAILAREWQELDIIRSVFEAADIPVSLNWGRSAFPGLIRIRENADLLTFLHTCSSEQITAKSLLHLLPEQGSSENIWQTNLRNLIIEWIDETGNSPQPVARVENYFYESLADQHRSRTLANGIFISTVHSIKGLEFDHVFVLDGNWQKTTGSEMEEERRLYYVAMSRARETLQLFAIHNSYNPHIQVLAGDFLVSRKMTPLQKVPQLLPHYALLGMKELFIDFAGVKGESHPTYQAIKELTTGDQLTANQENNSLQLLNHAGTPVACLSKNAQSKWQHRLNTIKEIKVIALARRYRGDIKDKEFQQRCQSDSWEVPIVELSYLDTA